MLLTPVATIRIEAVAAMVLITIITPHGRGNVVAEGAVVEIELCEGGEELAVLDHFLFLTLDLVSLD